MPDAEQAAPLAPEELDALLGLALRARSGPQPWLSGTAEEPKYLFLVPMWDGSIGGERAPVDAKGKPLGQALREHVAKFGKQPTLELVWSVLTGEVPRRFPIPIEPSMDELKDCCDAGELLIGISREGEPRVFRFAAFDEVYEVTLELADGRRVARPWSDWAMGLEVLFSL